MITRRAILNALAVTPLTTCTPIRSFLKSELFVRSGASALVQPAALADTYQLNIICHGLYAFACNRRSNMFEAYVPVVSINGHYHVYRAGTWTLPECDDPSVREPDLTLGEEYTLVLPGYTGSNNAFPTKNVDSEMWITSAKTKISISQDIKQRYCRINLPVTQNLRVAHRVSKIDKTPFVTGTAAVANTISPTRLARTYIFSYKSHTPFFPYLLKRNNEIQWQRATATDDLHIFSEPDMPLQANDTDTPVKAFGQLIAMLGLAESDLAFIPLDPGNIRVEEVRPENETEKSLSERLIDICPPGSSLGGETANCVAIFIDQAP